MLFEIECEDKQSVMKSLGEFRDEAALSYKYELEKAKQKIKTISYLSPVAAKVPLPEEISMFFWEEKGLLYFRIIVYVPRILKLLRKTKKLEDNLKLFLESKGHKIKKLKLIEG
jgi:hypothetical protein